MPIASKWGVLLALAITLWTLAVHLLGFYTDRIQYASLVDQVVIILPLTMLTLALLGARPLPEGRRHPAKGEDGPLLFRVGR